MEIFLIMNITSLISIIIPNRIRKILSVIRRAAKPRPTRSFTEYFKFIKTQGYYPATVIDVGAANGTPPLFESFPDAYFILIEPLEEFHQALIKHLKKYNGELHKCAVMSKKGRKTIFRTNDLYGSSMIHSLQEEDCDRLTSVDVKVLDHIIDSNELKKPVILKTDCQGGDFEVIKGASKTLDVCDIVIMEISFYKFWGEHHPEPLDILNYMNEKGFVIHDILDGLFRPLDNALGQVDICFVKKDGIFKHSNDWQ